MRNDDPDPLVIEKKSAKTPSPSILKSSTRNVFEIRSLLVASQVMPTSPNVFGRSVEPEILYCPRLRMFGVAASGPGGQPVILGFQLRPVKFSTKL